MGFFFFQLGTNLSNKKCLIFLPDCSDDAPCPSQPYAAGRGFSLAQGRCRCCVVVVVNDRSPLPPRGTFSLSLPLPQPGVNGFCWSIVGMSLRRAPALSERLFFVPVLPGLRPGSATRGGAGAGREAQTKAEYFCEID